MKPIEKQILNWRMEQIKLGNNPTTIALSPWDVDELRRTIDRLYHYNYLITQNSTLRIFGLDIIETPIQQERDLPKNETAPTI
jgi:hypothetical protein